MSVCSVSQHKMCFFLRIRVQSVWKPRPWRILGLRPWQELMWDPRLGKEDTKNMQGLGSALVSRCCYNNLPNFKEHCSFLLLALPFAYVDLCAWNDLLPTVSTVLTQPLGLNSDIASSRKASLEHPATAPLGKCLCMKPCMYPHQHRCHNQLPLSGLLLPSSSIGALQQNSWTLLYSPRGQENLAWVRSWQMSAERVNE